MFQEVHHEAVPEALEQVAEIGMETKKSKVTGIGMTRMHQFTGTEI